MKCDICGSTKSYVKEYENNFTIKGKNISFVSKRRFCKNCNNLVYDDELDNEVTKIAISKYNSEYGITKEEIINLRNRFNLSQELFSKVIGCAKKTLISYEKGTSIPNDCYLIILKCLNSNPEIISTLINSNKELFSNKELNRINSKLSNNLNQLICNSEFKPNEYNGYTRLSKEKIYNMILLLSKPIILKTKLLKEMFYCDFIFYKNNCKSITGLEYYKLPYGPVPDEFQTIINECYKNKIIDYKVEYIDNYEYDNINSNKQFDENIFNKDELETIMMVKEKFASYGLKEIADYSHLEKAYIESKDGEKISYDYAFDIKE